MIRKVLALLLALLLTLSLVAGAETLSDEPAEQAEEAASAEAEEAAQTGEEGESTLVPVDEMPEDTVLVRVNGDEITLRDVKSNYQYYRSYYSMYGMDFSDVTMQYYLLLDCLNRAITEKLMLQKGAEMGLDDFTDEEAAGLLATAQERYQKAYDEVSAQLTDSEKTDEENEAAILAYLQERNYTQEDLVKALREYEIEERVYNAAIADVTVTDEEIEALWREKVEEAKSTYADDPGAFGSDMTYGEAIYYAPAGYRTVKHILVKDENASEMMRLTAEIEDENTDEETRAADREKLDELMAQIQPKLDEIQSRIDAGEDFDALIAEYGEDPGMQNGDFAQTGYYVSDATTDFVTSFKEGAMALENVGDVSQPILSDYGFHIIKYISNVEEEEKALTDEMRQALRAEALSAKQSEAFNAQVTAWVQESEIDVLIDA